MKSKKVPLTAQEKEDKHLRAQQIYLHNKIKGAWSFGQIKSFQDLYELYEWPLSKSCVAAHLSSKPVFQDVKDFLEDRRVELETFIWLKHNPPQNKWDIQDEIFNDLLPTVYANIQPTQNIPPVEEEIRTVELEPCPLDKASLYWFQKKATKQILHNCRVLKHRADLLVAATGSGKTFIAGAFLARLIHSKWHEGKTFTPWPYVYVTKASVVEQTQRVLKNFFGLSEEDVLVINIDQLRAQFGRRFVKEEITVEDGIESCKWTWRPNIFPVVILWDECQSLKNKGSQQSQIAQAYNDLDTENTYQLFISATPFTRVAEAKCFCVATHIPYTFGMNTNAPLTNEHWNDFSKNIANDYGRLDIKPEDHSPGAINRLMDYMNNYIHRVKGIKSQYKAFNTIKIIDFETEKGRNEYNNAWEKFQEEKAMFESDESMSESQSTFNILAQLQVFLKAAESNWDRVHRIARELYHGVQEGFASVAAVRFKITIVKVVEILVNDYGVKRDDISLIWGGAPQATKKQKLKKSILSNPALLEEMMKNGLTMDDMDLDDVEESDLQAYPPELRLGNQSKKERQKEIDRFQAGKALYCLYTLRAGGVGLSLHHTDEMTKEKVRHKPSGYAFVEDIPLIPTRPRKAKVTPTWSAIELVQGVGRCPRINSLSDTIQEMEFYRGTVEERQARVVGVKLHCLTKVVRNQESWEDLILGRKNMSDEEVEAMHMKEPEEQSFHNDDVNPNGGEAIEGTYIEDEEDEDDE